MITNLPEGGGAGAGSGLERVPIGHKNHRLATEKRVTDPCGRCQASANNAGPLGHVGVPRTV